MSCQLYTRVKQSSSSSPLNKALNPPLVLNPPLSTLHRPPHNPSLFSLSLSLSRPAPPDYSPMWYERPLTLCIGLSCGCTSAHSYQTLWLEACRQQCTSTLPPSGTTTGWRRGR